MENSVGKNSVARITRLCEQSRLNPKLVQWKTEKLLEPYRDAKQIVRRNVISEERIVNRALCLIREKYHKYQMGLGHKTKSIDFIIMEVLGTEWADRIIDKVIEQMIEINICPEYVEILDRTYLSLDKKSSEIIMDELNLSKSSYYRKKEQAVTLFGILLWTTMLEESGCCPKELTEKSG